MNLKTTVSMAFFERAMLRYVEELGLQFPDVVKRRSAALSAELLRFTPPKTYSQGRKAVKRDISRSMWLLDPSKIHNLKLRQAVIDAEFEVVRAFMELRRAYPGFTLKHFDPALHRSQRDRRGRVQRSKKVIVLEKREYNQYVRQVQGHVGSLKFGWAISARRLGVSIPAWVLGHSERAGSFSQDLNPKNPKIVMTNKSPGIDQLGAGFVSQMVVRQTRAMNRDVDQILGGRASRYFN